jgi:hypothetical protein
MLNADELLFNERFLRAAASAGGGMAQSPDSKTSRQLAVGASDAGEPAKPLTLDVAS